MKQIALALVVASVVASPAFATGKFDPTNPFDHATRTELKAEATTRANADKDLQKQIDQKGYDINTQAKRIDGVNADLQASKAAGAAAYNQIQGQIGAVQGAAQTANDRASSLEGRADAAEGAIRNVQDSANQANVKADQANTRLDSAEGAIRETNGAVASVNKDLQDSKAAGLAIAGALNDKIDQTRADGAAAIGQTNEAVKSVDNKANAINDDLQNAKAVGATAIAEQGKVNQAQAATNGHVQQQISDVNGKAVNAQNTADVAVGLGQKGINDAYNAQQAANHAEGTAQKAGNDAYNAQQTANTAVGMGQKNGNDIVNLQNTTSQHSTQINQNTADIKSNTTTINQHSQQITTIQQIDQRQDATLNQHTSAINNLDGRTSALEDYSRDMDVRLGGRLDSQQSQINKNARDIKEAKNMAAGALAVAGQQFCTGTECGFQTAISAATIGGAQALAVGMGGAVSENVFLNAAFTKAGSVSGGVVSGTYRFK